MLSAEERLLEEQQTEIESRLGEVNQSLDAMKQRRQYLEDERERMANTIRDLAKEEEQLLIRKQMTAAATVTAPSRPSFAVRYEPNYN